MRRGALAAALLLLVSAVSTAGSAPPEMAAVGLLSFGRAGKCTGTLIAPDLVLTAGHCVLRRDRSGSVGPKGVIFRTGAYPGHAARGFPASDVVVHPLYIGTAADEAAHIRNDAGLVRLRTPVPAEVARPMAVIASGIEGAATFLASYRAGRGERARERRCPILYEWSDVVSLSCDVRPGESGSPIIVARDGEIGLVGIVSASSRMQRTEMAIAAKAGRLVGGLKAFMGGF